ncbi:hypothetical protein ACT7CZ_03205, partial [Bacillus cereus]
VLRSVSGEEFGCLTKESCQCLCGFRIYRETLSRFRCAASIIALCRYHVLHYCEKNKIPHFR